MTIVAVWYRKDHHDLYAIADSRLAGATGTLTDAAPKFCTINVCCYERGRPEWPILDATVAIGYSGSSALAFSTIATVQAYCSSLSLEPSGSTPGLSDIAALVQRVTDDNFRDFGVIWGDSAACSFVIFGQLPADNDLRCFHVGASVIDSKPKTSLDELALVKEEFCISFGSASAAFTERLRNDMEETGNFHPFNVLSNMIEEGARRDIGGHIQVAIATNQNAILPHVMARRLNPDGTVGVSFLGRDVSEIGLVGECSVGIVAVGPDRGFFEKG